MNLLLTSTIKVSLIVLVALTAVAALRKRSASVRHWLLAAALLCAGAAPFLEAVVPAWDLRRMEPSGGELALGETVSVLQQVSPHERVNVGRMAGQLVLPIWMAGASFSLSLLLIGLGRLAWLASSSKRVTRGPWHDLAEEISRKYALRRPVLLLHSDHPTLLVTWGLMRPKVILPHAAREWSEDRARIVLCHELAHIRRRDWIVQMAAEVVRSVYWFNPLVWIACRRLRQESEQACDDRVLDLGVERTEYATELLDLARAFKTRQRMPLFGSPAPAIAHPSSLERRIRAMLNARLNRTPVTRSASIVTAIALVAITVSIAGFGAAAQSGAATFSGTLLDAIGRLLPDKAVVLANVQSKTKHETRTDQNGHFEFGGLPAGEYLLETELVGFAREQGRVTLAAGQNLKQDVVLQLGSLSETISVTGGTDSGGGTIRQSLSAPTQPEFDPCSQSAVGGCITQPRKLRDVRPRYPRQLWEAGKGGTVRLEGRIGTDGFLKDLRVMAPADPDLANAAVEAASQWQFSQTRLDGVPIEVRLTISATFKPQQ